MADTKPQKLEREYIIPLRRAWLRVPKYERTGKAVKAIRIFIAKHMKIPERDIEKVKLDVYFNNDLWFRGRANPPAKIKVKATKEDELVRVTFAETPEHVKYLKSKNERLRKKAETKPEEVKLEQKKTEVRTEEQKTAEKEKEKAVEQQQIKQAEQEQKVQKHLTSIKEPKIQRMALKK